MTTDVPIEEASFMQQIASMLPSALGWFCATRCYARDEHPLATLRVALQTADLSVVVVAGWRRTPTPEDVAALSDAVNWGCDRRIPIVSQTPDGIAGHVADREKQRVH